MTEEQRHLIGGVYVGVTPTTLASGRPISSGDRVVVDPNGEDAHLLPQIASQGPVVVAPIEMPEFVDVSLTVPMPSPDSPGSESVEPAKPRPARKPRTPKETKS